VDELASASGVPEEDLAEAVDELARLGFAIESHPLGGLRLVGVPPLLFENEIVWGLGTARVGRTVRCLAAAPSTNDVAWASAEAGQERADGLAVFAEYQSAGRGRRGNRWLAPPHTSVLCSVLVWMPDLPGQGAVLTRASALAAAEAIEGECRLPAGIKWPNDLVIEDRKVGGIVVESRPAAGRSGPVVIGIGINCGQHEQAFPQEIRAHVASLAMFGEEADRTLLARAVLEKLDQALTCMADDEGVAEIRRRVAGRCRTIGRRIVVREGNSTFTGEVADLDPDYGLVLRLSEGGLRSFAPMTSQVLTQGDLGNAEKPC
jgi:BirA family biotin operon repressor/biotin-[acetyl-CoA-carboxylase] ligase